MHLAMVFLLAVPLVGLGQDPPRTLVQQQGKASLWLSRPAADARSVKLSETLTILMRVEGEAGMEVELTEKVRSSEGWYLELLGKSTMTPLGEGKVVRWEQPFQATPRKPGEHPLKLPALQIIDKDGEECKVPWEPLPLKITTRVEKIDAGEIRDRVSIEELPPLPPPAEPPWWPWLLTGLPLGAAAALVAWRWRRRPAPEPSASEHALRDLEELSRLQPDTASAVHGMYTRLSEVLRHYLEKRFGLPATQRTTTEFFAALAKASPLDESNQSILCEILKECDLAKFACLLPAKEECQRVLKQALEFVKRTGEEKSVVV
jgi:Domain of unknown function (DUF4381)